MEAKAAPAVAAPPGTAPSLTVEDSLPPTVRKKEKDEAEGAAAI